MKPGRRGWRPAAAAQPVAGGDWVRHMCNTSNEWVSLLFSVGGVAEKMVLGAGVRLVSGPPGLATAEARDGKPRPVPGTGGKFVQFFYKNKWRIVAVAAVVAAAGVGVNIYDPSIIPWLVSSGLAKATAGMNMTVDAAKGLWEKSLEVGTPYVQSALEMMSNGYTSAMGALGAGAEWVKGTAVAGAARAGYNKVHGYLTGAPAEKSWLGSIPGVGRLVNAKSRRRAVRWYAKPRRPSARSRYRYGL